MSFCFLPNKERVPSVECMTNPLYDCIRCPRLPWRQESALIGVSSRESQLEIKHNYSPPPNIHLQRSQNNICHSVSSYLNHARSASVFFQARERVSSVEYMINPLYDCIRCSQLPWRRESALIGVSSRSLKTLPGLSSS
ncbi:hypothetical protein CEXT_658161 [Caerostris extrusa]|uniref:Uncharacterized protein n=1 Tax=Caerostris extrusa TaxID=172846 RepID=A0AAV4S0D4_CAEEX|nr:hypothetical protein CEXT_658161 [Caerostris extrusa]